jgi:nonsense-mediated mRNA decay protein 3
MGSWVARSELEERVLGKTRFAFDVLEKRMELEERGKEILVKCSFALSVDGKRVEGKEEAFIPVEKGLCPECELRASGYYEAIFQVRGENREKMEKTAQRLSRLVEKRSFVSKVVSLKEGIDLFVGNRKEAMEIASHLGLETTVSNKLAGKRKDGKSLFRTTVCVRV